MFYKTEFSYEFKIPFKYHSKGELVDATLITVKAPSNKVGKFLYIIENERGKAVRYLQDRQDKIDQPNTNAIVDDIVDENGAEAEIKESDVVDLLSAAGSDLGRCFDALKGILTAGNNDNPVAVINNEERVTDGIFDKMSYNDTKSLLGRYILDFLSTSQGR